MCIAASSLTKGEREETDLVYSSRRIALPSSRKKEEDYLPCLQFKNSSTSTPSDRIREWKQKTKKRDRPISIGKGRKKTKIEWKKVKEKEWRRGARGSVPSLVYSSINQRWMSKSFLNESFKQNQRKEKRPSERSSSVEWIFRLSLQFRERWRSDTKPRDRVKEGKVARSK